MAQDEMVAHPAHTLAILRTSLAFDMMVNGMKYPITKMLVARLEPHPEDQVYQVVLLYGFGGALGTRASRFLHSKNDAEKLYRRITSNKKYEALAPYALWKATPVAFLKKEQIPVLEEPEKIFIGAR